MKWRMRLPSRWWIPDIEVRWDSWSCMIGFKWDPMLKYQLAYFFILIPLVQIRMRWRW